jgi:cytidine deaminase
MERLIEAALRARDNARPDYSRFYVGAAIEDAAGRIHAGCNVESASYGLTMCAERTALFRAIADGASAFRRLVVVADSAGAPTPPCGACRQVLYDFCGPDLEILLLAIGGARRTFFLRDLLPEPFHAGLLKPPAPAR